MQKYFGYISYNGKLFHGSQDQKSEILQTVQSVLKKNIERIFARYKTELSVRLASRTDAGVHAYKNAFDFFLKFDNGTPVYPSSVVKKAINWEFLKLSYKNNDYVNIHVPHIYLSEPDFDSRADAISRKYIYKILFKPSQSDGDENLFGNNIDKIINNDEATDFLFMKNYYYYITPSSTSLHKKLNFKKIEEILEIFQRTGYDFSNFMKIDKSAYYNPMRKIEKIELKIINDPIHSNTYRIYIIIEAKSFLRNQIRILINSILDYACGKTSKEEILDYLMMNKINIIKTAAPPEGLYLSDIIYDKSKFDYHEKHNKRLEEEFIIYRDKMFNRKKVPNTDSTVMKE